MFNLQQMQEARRKDERNLDTLILVNTYGVPVGRLAKVVGVSRQTIYRRMNAAKEALRHKYDKSVADALEKLEQAVDAAAEHRGA